MNEQQYQEIDLIELLRHILAKWWLILLLMVISGATAFYITTERIVPVYQAQSTIFIGKESSSITDLNINDFNLENKLVVDYRELIKTRLVTEEVIQELGLVSSTNELIMNMDVQTIQDSRFMHISFKDPVPERAMDIANKLSEILAEKAESIVGVKNIQIVDYAILPEYPISPSLKKNVAIAAVLGMMIGLFVVFVNMMMINTIQKEEDVEKEIGLPVIGVIPHFKGEDRK